MDEEPLKIVQDGEVLWVTLNRPERLNALSRKLVEDLRELFVGLYWRHEIRAVVLRGAGANFCAGLDLKERGPNTANTPGNGLVSQRKISEIVIAMRRCPQPIIALMDGSASGGGFALALASDIRIATPIARMNAAFIKLGLSGCDIGVSYFLPRMVGSSVAAELLMTGRFLHADRAAALGLRLTKEALNHAIDAQGLEAAIAMEDRNQILCVQGEDFQEGVRAFLEKRPPVYGGAKAS